MTSAFKNNRAVAALFTAGIAFLLLLLSQDLAGNVPFVEPALDSPPALPSSLVPLAEIESLFASTNFARLIALTNQRSLFYTTFFQPPPKPQAATTRKVALVYQGFYETTGGRKQAYLRVGDALVVGGLGEKILADLAIAEIALKTVALTNAAPPWRTNILSFNARQEVEVPVP